MAEGWRDRNISAPSAEFVTADEFGELLRVSGDYIRDLVEAGELPPPQKSGRREVWDWEVVVMFRLRRKYGLVGEEAGKRGK
jgi:hypothetical protein